MQQLNLKPNHKPVQAYYKALQQYELINIRHETAVKLAFQNLLESCCRQFNWTLVAEYGIKRPKLSTLRVDGALIDDFKLAHGFWEAKDQADDLAKEAKKKFEIGYPKENILFQAPERAILYQNGRQVGDEDITKPENLVGVLETFFGYTKPAYEQWDEAVAHFKDEIPKLGDALKEIIERERKINKKFIAAFDSFLELCRQSINPNLSEFAVEEMLIQHLLTERIFRTVFNNPDFVNRNIIAAEIEKVIHALMSKSFSRQAFLSRLDHFYKALEVTAATIEDFSEKQSFLNTVYEKFFQGFSVKVADTHGIVYTPQPIVNFMVRSVEDILHREFGKSLSSKDVHILDPFVGTGNFIVRVMQEIKKTALPQKFKNELHCNEVMLLPYYVASMNIEHEFFELTGNYEPFEGVCFVDTFELAESHQRTFSFMTPENTQRVERQKSCPITVVIGNPPYNVGQLSENDNNKNRKYKVIDKRVSDTYAKDSQATNKKALSDPYVKSVRWATDRIGKEGIVAFVTNSSYIHKGAFDGMRKHLSNDFDAIYILDLKGDVRTDSMREGKPIGEENTIFGLAAMVGIAIAFLVRTGKNQQHKIHYAGVDWKATRLQKFSTIEKAGVVSGFQWKELKPDSKTSWMTEGLREDFSNFLPIGSKEAKTIDSCDSEAIFRLFSGGVKTNRDSWVTNFREDELSKNVRTITSTYNEQTLMWAHRLDKTSTIDDFVISDDRRISWSEGLKKQLQKGALLDFDVVNIRPYQYRPFTRMFLYFDGYLNERRYLFPRIFPGGIESRENRVICVGGYDRKAFSVMISDRIPDINFFSDPQQSFPYFVYDEETLTPNDNISAWGTDKFHAYYKDRSITRWDIFYYVYGILHHPIYCTQYAANLKRDFPRIPFAPDFRAFADAGKRLAELHVNYEQQPEYTLVMIENAKVPLNWRVEKMRLSKDKTTIIYNEFLTLSGIPAETFEYRLGNRSALDWVIDQYQVSTDKRSGIVNDPNRLDEEQYIVRLIGQVITVSLETVKIVKSLPDLGLPND